MDVELKRARTAVLYGGNCFGTDRRRCTELVDMGIACVCCAGDPWSA